MRKSRLDKAKADILRMYWEEGKTVRDIADIYGAGVMTVDDWLKKNGGARPTGPVKEKITSEDEARMEPYNMTLLPGSVIGTKALDSTSTASQKGEVFDDLCKDILEQLQAGKIGKQEAQLKWMFLNDEFEELGQLDFNQKYAPQVNKAPRS
jgi:hypothetical protein